MPGHAEKRALRRCMAMRRCTYALATSRMGRSRDDGCLSPSFVAGHAESERLAAVPGERVAARRSGLRFLRRASVAQGSFNRAERTQRCQARRVDRRVVGAGVRLGGRWIPALGGTAQVRACCWAKAGVARPALPVLKFEEDVIGWGIPMPKSQGRVV